jgi:hypothetical protein
LNGSSRGGILVCEECGERVMLEDPPSVRCSAGTHFGCECGEGEPLAAIPLSRDHQGRSGSLELRIGGG